ncbi:MAG: hypothetical protein JWO47_495 [Candidatus Saccharibacteria bacterium]|nr:hypothetical protein [Candidatus Saccharibacteria bacterium]
MASFKTLGARLICLEAALELASDAYSDQERDHFSEDIYETAAKIKETIPYAAPTDLSRFLAIRVLPNIPALMKIKVFQEKPNEVQLQKAFDTHRVDLNTENKALRELIGDTPTPELNGVLAESFVLLSLQRYALKTHPDMTWVPLPSVGREDSTGSEGSVFQPTWDISVYTALDEQPELTYKVQVKKGREGLYPRQYADDITMVYACEDLAFPSERNVNNSSYVSVPRLLREIAPDADSRAVDRWDSRTEKLLDILN